MVENDVEGERGGIEGDGAMVENDAEEGGEAEEKGGAGGGVEDEYPGNTCCRVPGDGWGPCGGIPGNGENACGRVPGYGYDPCGDIPEGGGNACC